MHSICGRAVARAKPFIFDTSCMARLFLAHCAWIGIGAASPLGSDVQVVRYFHFLACGFMMCRQRVM